MERLQFSYSEIATNLQNGKMKRRTAPERIAFLYSCDIRDVTDMRYQPGVYASPGIYLVNDEYHCCPSGNQKLPKGFAWREIGEAYDRKVYKAKEDQNDNDDD